MSYILDALKKSEALRHAGRIPTVAAPHGAQIEAPPSSRVGVLGWVLLALALVLGVAWLGRQFLGSPPWEVAVAPAAAPTPPLPAAANVVSAANSLASAESPKGGETIPRLKLAINLPPREPPAAAASGGSAKPVAPPAPRDAPPVTARESASPMTTRDAVSPGPARSAVLSYADLPPAIRQGLPPLVVGGFAAGESGGTMVMVDDKLVREGDEVIPGLRVVKVTTDSAEFSYKGYRFRR